MQKSLQMIEDKDLSTFKNDMQEAFQKGAEEAGFPTENQLILPEEDINLSLLKPNAQALKLMLDGQMVGGAIVVLDAEKRTGELDFLYVKHGTQGKGLGKFIWFEIEKRFPDIAIWETSTPHFETRNIHFYINVCGFHAVEYFHPGHPMKDSPEMTDEEDSGMFLFRKVIHNKM